jgi:hypothetical protein
MKNNVEFPDLRLQKLERRLRLSNCLWLLTMIAVTVAAWARTAETQQNPSALRASELVVVDQKGAERVRISGELPDAMINGKRVPRGEKAAGVVLYDAAGNERSGYVTFEPSGNVGLTLDTKKQQVAFFVAGPDSGSALQMWNGTDLVELRSDENGSRVTAVKDRQVVMQEPAVTKMSAETCEAYRSARSTSSWMAITQEVRRALLR